MATFDFSLVIKKRRNAERYNVALRVWVDGKHKTTFDMVVDSLAEIDKRAYIKAANYVSDVEGLNIHEKLWTMEKDDGATLSHVSSELNSAGKVTRFTCKEKYRGQRLNFLFTIDDPIKKGGV